MRANERVLSDVHLRAPEGEPTVFEWRAVPVASSLEIDADGDAVLSRRHKSEPSGSLTLRHTLDSKLVDVGLQVWRGALLLADYLVACPSLAQGTVLELGSGCGLCGLLAARLGAQCYLTDIGDGVLHNTRENARQNGLAGSAHVRRLDWLAPWAPDAWAAAPADAYDWREADAGELRRCRLILAADCVYDDVATSALVVRLADLLRWLPADAAALVAIERRTNFCIDSMSARAPALDHFLSELEARGQLECARMDCAAFPQAFAYERVKELELFRVTLKAGSEIDETE